jgi:hypothetical protein
LTPNVDVHGVLAGRCSSCATEISGAAERRDQVNVLAIYVANEYLQFERDRAFDRDMAFAMPDAPSLRNRIASAVAGLRRLAGNSVESATVLPKLENYPYRG